MPKAYWISTYRAVNDSDKLAAYAKLAGPALTANGARFLARGEPSKVYELGLMQRTVLIEFDSVEQAVAAHDSPACAGRWSRPRDPHHRSSLSMGAGSALSPFRVCAGKFAPLRD